MKKFRHFVTAIAVTIGLSTSALVFTAPAANATEAEEPPSCSTVTVGEGTGECADVVGSESHSNSSSESKAVSVNGVDINSSVTVLARIRANGTPAAQQTNCFHTNRAMSLWTSYNAEGTTGWHWKHYPKGKRFCRINGAVRDPICHNQVKIGVPKSKPPKNAIRGEVKFVKRLQWKVEAVAKADEKVTSLAKAWCNTQSAYAYGEGRGSASAYAIGRGSARGSVLVTLFAQAESQAAGNLSLQLGGRSVVKVKADVRASAFATARTEAHALAKCKDIPPPPPPPPANKPPTCELVQKPEHLFVSLPGKVPNRYRAKVVWSDPDEQLTKDDGVVTVTGNAFIVKNNPDFPEIWDVEGTQVVYYFWIEATQQTGNATLKVDVADSKGDKCSDSKTFPVVADEF